MTETPLPLVSRSSGLLKPVLSALQHRALRDSVGFGPVFLIGLGGQEILLLLCLGGLPFIAFVVIWAGRRTARKLDPEDDFDDQ